MIASAYTYKVLTGHKSALATAQKSGSPIMQEYAGQIRAAVDAALERSAPAGVRQALSAARLQYKNLKTIEPLVLKGEPGEISPRALMARANVQFPGRALRSEQPDLGELADIGARFNLVPDSDTAGRSKIYDMLAGGGATAMAGLTLHDPMKAAMVAGSGVASLGIGAAAGARLRSEGYINRLINSGLNPNAPAAGLLNQLAPYAAPVAAIGTR